MFAGFIKPCTANLENILKTNNTLVGYCKFELLLTKSLLAQLSLQPDIFQLLLP